MLIFEVTPMRERGRLVPRWQYGRVMRSGQLEVDESRDPSFKRVVRRARVLVSGTDQLLPLLDARLIAVRGEVMTLSGFEAVAGVCAGPDDASLFQQSWVLVWIGERGRSEARR